MNTLPVGNEGHFAYLLSLLRELPTRFSPSMISGYHHLLPMEDFFRSISRGLEPIFESLPRVTLFLPSSFKLAALFSQILPQQHDFPLAQFVSTIQRSGQQIALLSLVFMLGYVEYIILKYIHAKYYRERAKISYSYNNNINTKTKEGNQRIEKMLAMCTTLMSG